jgi:hypothetical protein
MRLLNSLTQLIIEAKVDDIYEKYYKNIPRNVFDRIVKADPRTITNNNIIVKVGKYAKVLLNIYNIGNMPNLENLVEATRYLKIIYAKNLSVDITKINEISDLYPIVKDYIVSVDMPINEILKHLPDDSYKLLFNGEKWMIFTPKTEQAAAYLGVSTTWCTTWGKYCIDPAYKSRDNYFKAYNQDTIYIMIDKEDEKNKYQFQFAKNEFRNSKDGRIDPKYFLDLHKELREFYFPLLVSPNEQSIITEEEQFNRTKALSRRYAVIIKKIRVDRLVDEGMSNPLALAFLEEQSRSELADWNENKTPFIDDGIIQDIDYEDINIVFTLDRECKNSTVRDADNHMSYLEGESGDYSRLSDDVYQYNDDSSFKDDLSRYIDDYFESHKDSISYLSYNFSSLDKFKEYFKDVVSTERSTYYDKIKEKYIDKMYDLTYPVYQSQVEDELNAVKEYYTIESYYAGSQEIKFNLYEFAKFLEEQEITQITDFCDLFENYIDYSGINYDDYYIDINYQYPETDSIIEEYLNEFIENEFDDIENQSSEVRETRLELMKLLSKYYDSSSTGFYPHRDYNYKFNGSLVTIYLNPEMDTDDLTVKVVLVDKKTKTEYTGNMPIRDLYTNMFNYKLDLVTKNSDLEEV